MDIAKIRHRILTDDDFVLSETKKLQYLYGLKTEIRYGLDRDEKIETESVAEHVYGMHVLANYFLPLEDTEAVMDWQKIFQLITWHDIDEVETGDMIGYLKTEEIRTSEAQAAQRVIQQSPELIGTLAKELLNEYEALTTIETKFVKAIDRIEPIFHLYTEQGRKIFAYNKTRREQSDGLKAPYVKDYPYIKRFFEVVSERLAVEGFYAE